MIKVTAFRDRHMKASAGKAACFDIRPRIADRKGEMDRRARRLGRTASHRYLSAGFAHPE